VAKAASHWLVANYRDAYDMFCCNGLLFNHESPLRPRHFVTKKVVAAACRIASGSDEKLQLGNLSVKRDWGWAPEYVRVMWAMLQQDHPSDYVIATGEAHTLSYFVENVFTAVGLNWRDHVFVDECLQRPSDISYSRGRPHKAHEILGWRATHGMSEVAKMMVTAEQASVVKLGVRSAGLLRNARIASVG
jgi:GDPmannose 4,6-dehydratase